jgi:Protein of unknown function (DUF3078)
MMKNLLTFLTFCLSFSLLYAQKDPSQMTDKRLDEVSAALKKENAGWVKGGDLGATLSGGAIRRRRLADGGNQFGYQGLINLFANNNRAKSFWENSLMLNFSALRTGGSGNAFQKLNDILRLNSTWGYKISGEKWFAALDGRVETQLAPTYDGGFLSGEKLFSEFFAPINVLVAPGIAYRATPQLTFFVSPAAAELIFVGNDALARQAGEPLGNEAGKNNRLLLGPAFRAKYTNTFFKERVALNSSLGWSGNYRDNVNGRVLWANQLGFQIFKGFGVKLLGEMFYDHYTKAVIAEATETTPIRLGLDTTLRGSFFFTYSRIFGAKK